MVNDSQHTANEGQVGNKSYLLTGDGVLDDPNNSRHAQKKEGGMPPTLPLSYDQTYCIHTDFVECCVAQAFPIASNFDPKLMPEEQNQITMKKVCVIW